VINLEFKQLEAYVKVYEIQNFSKAAEDMFISQPSISAYINSLEKEIQTQLIYRSTKEFMPTKSGRLFYEYAKDMLSLRDKSVFSLKSLSGFTGNIDILASSVPAQYILPEMLGAFHEQYPAITFNLKQADTAEVVNGISLHKSEIGFVGAKIKNPKCMYEDFMSEKLLLIAPYEERFHRISPSDIPQLLCDEYFVMREVGSGTRLEYEEFLKNIGVKVDQLRVSAYLNNTQSIIYSVANGLGLSIVSELAAKYYVRQKMITSIDISPLPVRSFYIVLKKNCAIIPAVDAFVKFAHSYACKYDI
jgi:DNA-binding transcriptional LysR family regulator